MIKFLDVVEVITIHQNIIEKSGGAFGIRNKGLLVSALERPKNLQRYCPTCSVFELAAPLVSGITLNHPFIDGNKRCGLMSGLTFLRLNNLLLKKLDILSARELMINLAKNTVSDMQIAKFFENLCY